MSADLMPFVYDGATVRTVLVEGEPWFVLADLCAVLDIRNVKDVRDRLGDGVDQTYPIADSLGRTQNATIVSEAGMYEVVIRSDKPGAVAFRRWITAEVLPAIRKTGAYAVAASLPDRKALAQMVIEAEEAREAEHAARVEAERHARELAAPASAWSHMAESSGDYEVADAAKVLSRDPQISIGRDRLFRFMQAEGWIYRDPGTSRWKAYQTQVNTGRLAEKLGRPFLHEPSGEMRLPAPTIRITAKGLAELHKRLGGTDALPTLAAVGE